MGKKGWVALWLAGLLLLGRAEQFPAVPADGTAALPQQRYVALTFDDGPKRETTARLLLATASDPAVAAQEIQKTDTLLREILGDGTYWLRPPYGAIQEAQKPQIPVPMVTWTVDSRDWESLNAKTVVQSVLRDVKPNSIILMHDIYPSSVDAALEIVDTLQAQGYWFVTVEELLALNGVAAEPGVLYRVIG